MPEEVRADLEFIQVETMDQVLEHALDRPRPEAEPDASRATPDAAPATYAH